VLIAAALACVADATARAQPPVAQASGVSERTVWNFYKVRWGHQDEFLDLFQRNHYPILKERLKRGRLTSIRTYVPTYHGDGRSDWTFAVELRYRDNGALFGPDDTEGIVSQLYPDRRTFDREEKRRFEILDAHWDVLLNQIDLDARRLAVR
jgi:hypothetical protein